MQRIRAASAILAIVTSDDPLADLVSDTIRDESTSVQVHGNFPCLVSSFGTVAPDVVVVDDLGPHDAAHEIRHLRRRAPSVQIVYVRVPDENRSIALLHTGADDVIMHDSPTLVPRLQAATRRARTLNAGHRIAVGDIVFDREARRVWCAGREVALTPHEYGVVDCLFWHTPRPVNVDTLADFVWGSEDINPTNRRTLVQVYVSYVRKKLARSAQVAIRFARGSGYEFAPVQSPGENFAGTAKG